MAGAAAALDVGGRLAALERAGLVRRGHRVRPAGPEGALPVPAELRGVLPGGLPRGGTVAVAASGPASTSLLILLLAAVSQAGGWCALVGLPALSPIAAAEAGISLGRLALLPEPGPDVAGTVAVLLDGLEVVVVGSPQALPAAVCGRLAARARQRGSVLVPYGPWAGADVSLRTEHGVWDGLGQGRGRVQCREVTVVAQGRGAAVRPRQTTLWLPKASGLYAQRQAAVSSETPTSGRRLVVVPAPVSGSAASPAAPGAVDDGSGSIDQPRRADLAS